MGDHLSLRKLPQLVGYDKSAHSLNKVMRRVQQDLDTHSSPVYSSRDTGDVCVEGTSEDTSVMDGPFAHVACLLDRQRAHRLRQVVDAIVARDIGTGRQPQTILATVIALMSAQGHLKPYIPLDESCQTAGISEATVLGFLTAEGKRLMAVCLSVFCAYIGRLVGPLSCIAAWTVWCLTSSPTSCRGSRDDIDSTRPVSFVVGCDMHGDQSRPTHLRH
mmetsp:Transcript_68753/g.161648  ORF Transcript_68753/g.161648 Transcript_68753/m.161648 type:complete len:218 (+) Transcript_68753:804-1457(+)